jgi:hypothetical protein
MVDAHSAMLFAGLPSCWQDEAPIHRLLNAFEIGVGRPGQQFSTL